MVNEINKSRLITQRSWCTYTYDQCWTSALHEIALWYQEPLVSSCQQPRHGTDIMNMHVDLSMMDR